jgi:type I restriction enzyme S subunit
VFDVPPFKHIYVDETHGVPFFTSGELFLLDRRADKHLSRRHTRGLEKYIIRDGWVLLARSGQLGGIIGRPQMADSSMRDVSTSDHVVRIVATSSDVPAGYIFAYLSTPHVGYHLLTRTMTGASVPALWPKYLNQVRVLQCSEDFMFEIDRLVVGAFEMKVLAAAKEQEARFLVERAIEEAG